MQNPPMTDHAKQLEAPMQNDTRTAGQKIADEYYESTELTKPRLARMIDTALADLLERLKSEKMVETAIKAYMHSAGWAAIDKSEAAGIKAALAAVIEELRG